MTVRPPSAASPVNWEHFPHEADVGVRGTGASMADAFAGAAHALTAVVTDLERVRPLECVEFRCQSPDPEILLYDFLNTLIYEMAVSRRLFSHFQVSIREGCLVAEAWGETVDVARHQPSVELKGATFTELSVRQLDHGQWIAQCVLDI